MSVFHRPVSGFLIFGCLLFSVPFASAADPVAKPNEAPTEQPAAPLFRTEGGDPSLPWFQLQAGEFPPEGSARYIAGELIALDHVNRAGVLRPDRTDAQRRGDWDLPLAFTLLPYGAVRYHGAPAELRDVPIGTHLHGWFYVREPLPKGVKPKPPAYGERRSLDADFDRCLMLEDDFSYCLKRDRRWRVDSVDLVAGVLTVVGQAAGKPDSKPTLFQITPATRVWKGRGLGNLDDVKAGSELVLNLTVCTLKGPGRCTSIWLDADSLAAATDHQLQVHRGFQREHGLPGVVDAVDNPNGLVSVVLFAGFDPKLLDDFAVNDSVTAAVAEDNLRTWDQINDRKSGPVASIESIEPVPGSSGVRITFKPSLLIEGFRPKRIIRVWPSKWKVDDLPREERLYN